MNLSRNAWRSKGAIPVHFIKSGTWLDDLLLDDCPGMDLTVEMLGIGSMPGLMEFRPKSSCVVAGVEEAALLLERCGLAVTRHARNGDRAEEGQLLLEARGDAAALHRGWKISQTVMEYMSGIASRAARMVDAARAVNPRVRVAVTRKNFPGAKRLCLEAAVSGGAVVHRLNLSDSVLVFDQHRIFLAGTGRESGTPLESFARRIPEFRLALPEKKLCAEVDRPEDALLLAEAGIDIVQCEKFPCSVLADTVRALRAARPDLLILAAGGINGDNASDYAATGADELVTTWPYFGKPADIKVRMSAL